jgi:epoxyqueuosine reductase QueG
MSDAKSAISFTMPLDRDIIRAYLRKDMPNGRSDHEKDIFALIRKIWYTSKDLRDFLIEKGHSAVPFFPNNKYREDIPNWQSRLLPELSLRYVAVRSGAASYGWSGNVGIKNWGTAIKLGGVVTSAELEPTDPIPSEESFCDMCKLCEGVCPSKMFSRKEETSVTLGGATFSHAKRINHNRCHLTCGGFNGLHKSRKWSTWSPGRFDYPENDEELQRLFDYAGPAKAKRPNIRDDSSGYELAVAQGQIMQLTCGSCNIICWGDPKETAENYKLLTNSGCVIQKENGEMIVLPADEAEKTFNEMSPGHQSLYYTDYKSEMTKE